MHSFHSRTIVVAACERTNGPIALDALLLCPSVGGAAYTQPRGLIKGVCAAACDCFRGCSVGFIAARHRIKWARRARQHRRVYSLRSICYGCMYTSWLGEKRALSMGCCEMLRRQRVWRYCRDRIINLVCGEFKKAAAFLWKTMRYCSNVVKIIIYKIIVFRCVVSDIRRYCITTARWRI